MMLTVVVACVAAAAAAELHANPPLTAATPNRTRVHADAALLLAGLDWAGDAPDNATVAPIIRRHPLVAAFRRTKRLVGRVPKLYRWLTRLVNPRPVEPPPPPPEPVAAPATAPPVYDAGAALDAYARSCARYAVSANGAVLGALRFGGVCVKPSDESGGAPFGDADLLAVVDAICDPASVARALDLTRVDGARFTQACAARALSHALAKADRGRGLAYLALVGAPLGPRGAERLATAATPQLRALRLQGCDARDAGLDAFAQALGERLPQLERLDVSRNRASLHACKRLKKAAKARGANGGKKCRVELRGNCLALEMACAATHACGVAAWATGGPYLLHEAKRLGLDGACVRSLAVYASAHVFYFAASAQTHLAEARFGRARPALPGAPRPPPRSRWDRAAPALVLAATHYPFAAFLQLDAATSRRVHGAALALCAFTLCREPPGVDRDPPSLRVGKYAPVETLALLFVGSFAASATALPLRRALGDAAFRSLAAGALLHVAAAICHVAAGAGHAAAHALTLTGAALHAMVVLKSLVWHFLPAAPPAPRPPGAAPPV